MDSPHYRKIDLQSSTDLRYLHANSLSLSRQKLDLHFPPSASASNARDNDGLDPMRERVRELVDDFISRTFHSATPSLSINGLDAPSAISPDAETESDAQAQTRETVEYEPFDTRLAGRVTSLYAQLESLTTAVAQLRRDAPARAAGGYADLLKKVVDEEDEDDNEDESEREAGEDVEMGGSEKTLRLDTKLEVPLGTDAEAALWRDGDMALVYEDALRSLLRLQGKSTFSGDDDEGAREHDGNALASTVGKAERAGRAAEVVENM
ncbi:hypothetical protein PHISP_05239 [Aspergillus sp. HF37]|nr:hypothetical protein PHISP_05239 [Aspergillus sp. HF37]